jgi:DNA-binding NarL/FixJ family response regulator
MRLQTEFVHDPRFDDKRIFDVKRILTSRQREVLQLLVECRTMTEVATALHVTPRTVAYHKYRIMRDFGLKNISDIVKFAIREGLISP